MPETNKTNESKSETNKTNELKQNLTRSESWYRALLNVPLIFLLGITYLLVLMICLIQSIFLLLMAKPNEGLMNFGKDIQNYTDQVLTYVLFLSDSLPFPFTALSTKARVKKTTASTSNKKSSSRKS